jgi:hypothetical protein
MNENAKQKLADYRAWVNEQKENGTYIAPPRLNPMESAHQDPASKTKAIKAACWDCVGGEHTPNWQNEVSLCFVKKCALHHVRPYQQKGKV